MLTTNTGIADAMRNRRGTFALGTPTKRQPSRSLGFGSTGPCTIVPHSPIPMIWSCACQEQSSSLLAARCARKIKAPDGPPSRKKALRSCHTDAMAWCLLQDAGKLVIRKTGAPRIWRDLPTRPGTAQCAAPGPPDRATATSQNMTVLAEHCLETPPHIDVSFITSLTWRAPAQLQLCITPCLSRVNSSAIHSSTAMA